MRVDWFAVNAAVFLSLGFGAGWSAKTHLFENPLIAILQERIKIQAETLLVREQRIAMLQLAARSASGDTSCERP